jgi:hypothetical protein
MVALFVVAIEAFSVRLGLSSQRNAVIAAELVRSQYEVAHLGVVGQYDIDGHRRPALAALLVKHVSDRMRGPGTALVSFAQRGVARDGAMLVEQTQPPRRRAAEVASVQCDTRQEGRGVRACGGEPIAPAMLTGFALVGSQSGQVFFLLDLLATVPTAHVTRDFTLAIENTHAGRR